MAVLNVLKINDELAYIISDEEYLTRRGLRRTYHSNNIHSILDKEISEASGMNLVIGFVGFSNFGMELVQKLKERLASLIDDDKGIFPRSVSEIADKGAGIITELTKEKVNSRLEYLYGFNMDDINRTFISDNMDKTEIKQSDIQKKALEIINKKEKGGVIDDINKIEFIFTGYDKNDGIQIYQIQPENCVLNPMPSLFASIGAGADVCNLIFAEFINKTPLQKRREGIDPIEGLMEIFWSVNQASLYNHQVGGYCHLCIIDRKNAKSGNRIRMYSDHKPKVGSDIVKAYKKGWLEKEKTKELIRELFFGDLTFEQAEEQMFKHSSNKKEMDLFLRGYKYFENLK